MLWKSLLDWWEHQLILFNFQVLTIDANTDLSQMAPHYDLCEKTIFQNVAVANWLILHAAQHSFWFSSLTYLGLPETGEFFPVI